MSAFYFSKTFSVMYNIVYIFSKCKCFRGHSYAALKGRHLPAHAFCETAANAMMIPNDRRMNDIIEQLEANGQLAIQVMDAK